MLWLVLTAAAASGAQTQASCQASCEELQTLPLLQWSEERSEAEVYSFPGALAMHTSRSITWRCPRRSAPASSSPKVGKTLALHWILRLASCCCCCRRRQ